MPFKRDWDSSCPRVWDTWDGENGDKWVIRDLPPEDDELAFKVLLENLCPDEELCKHTKLVDDPESVASMANFWRYYLAQRMSLACYQEINGVSNLVAVNVCLVHCQGEEDNDVIEGRAWKNVYDALIVCDQKEDIFKYLGVNKVLYAFGLVVHREYRGKRLGSRVLAAREPLALHHGLTATSTVFTGSASQISAERVGFETVATVTWKELAEAGLEFPKDETRCIKLMAKKYV